MECVKQTESRIVSNCAGSCFYWYANHLPFCLLSMKLKYPGFFTTFQFASFHFILFLWKLNSFIWIYTFKRKKIFEETLCIKPWRYVSSSLHLHLRANYPSFGRFPWRQKCRLWFLRCLPFLGTLFILTIKIFLSFASDFSCQCYNVGKLWEML